MNTVRITKKFSFEMAHALDFHDGKCKNIHGHSYELWVTLIGRPNTDNCPEKGMLIDFSKLKKAVKSVVVDPLDHCLLLQNNSPFVTFSEQQSKLVLVDYQPTCENMVVDFAAKIKQELPEEIKLFSLKLKETASSYSEWYSNDNQ